MEESLGSKKEPLLTALLNGGVARR